MAHLKLTTAGESHGPAEICILEGIPAGLTLLAADVDVDLARRMFGYGRGARMQLEADRCSILSGVRLGRTLGTPICLLVENRDHQRWRDTMSAAPSVTIPPVQVTVPRPGHADLAGAEKFDHCDLRDVLERASARETVARVAAGAVAKALLAQLGVRVQGRVVGVGDVRSMATPDLADPSTVDWEAVEASLFGCDDPDSEDAMKAAVDRARESGESLGGVFEIWAWDVCPGLGSYASASERLDGRLMGAVGSIPAIKGVEIGPGFQNASLAGSSVHDAIFVEEHPSPPAGQPSESACLLTRRTNRAGGTEGGVSNGMPIVVRAAMKPIPTLVTPLPSVDLATMRAAPAHVERSDVLAVSAARVVGEAAVALVLADAFLSKFGGDCLGDTLSSYRTYSHRLEKRGLWRRS